MQDARLVPAPGLRLDERGVYRVPGWEAFAWLECGFGTRAAQDWTQGAAATLKQIHSNLVWTVNAAGGPLGEGDALVTNVTEIWLAVRTADCVPVVLADPEREAFAVVHAGWRGAVAGVVKRTLERMEEEFGSGSDSLHAAIGPAIGGCCFEVGPEVAAQFEPWFPERQDLHGRVKIDLEETVARQLAEAGVARERMARASLCTYCRGPALESFRRDGEGAGRMITAARKKRKGEV